MKIIALTDAVVQKSKIWQQSQASVFCLDSMRAYAQDYFSTGGLDHSFAVVDGTHCVALCWLSSFQQEMNFWGRPACYQWDEHYTDTKGLHKLVWENIESIASSNGARTMRLQWDAGIARLAWPQLNKQTIANEGLIPLTWPEDKILRSFRKSYRSLINWGKKELTTRVLDGSSMSPEDMRSFMLFHQQVAGKVTRSERSWQLQYEMVKRGEGFVILSDHKGALASACLILHSKVEAHYAVGVYDRGLMGDNLPLGHYPLWLAVTEARQRGIERFNLGDVGNDGGDKDRAIALFKRGFAVQIVASVVGNYEWSEASAAAKSESETP